MAARAAMRVSTPAPGEIYTEWAANQHFELCNDVPGVLRELTGAGIRIGLISNHTGVSTRSSLISSCASSSPRPSHRPIMGYMKPHPSIFRAALDQLGCAASDAVMVGDSVSQDIQGALRAGMRAVLLHRSDHAVTRADELRELGVSTIRSLTELVELVIG
jgi:putative hydrolase of the HAD superfamily